MGRPPREHGSRTENPDSPCDLIHGVLLSHTPFNGTTPAKCWANVYFVDPAFSRLSNALCNESAASRLNTPFQQGI